MDRGTLHTPKDAFDTKRADAVKALILRVTPVLKSASQKLSARDRERQIMEDVKYSLNTLRSHATLKLQSRTRL